MYEMIWKRISQDRKDTWVDGGEIVEFKGRGRNKYID